MRLLLLVMACSQSVAPGADGGGGMDMSRAPMDLAGADLATSSSYNCARQVDVHPGDSIAAATQAAKAGDCILVHSGTYDESSTIGFSSDGPIVVWSVDGRGAAVIDAAGNRGGPTVLVRQDQIIIDGFEFRNSPTDTGEQVVHFDGLLMGKGTGSVLRNCKITGGYDHIKLNQASSGITVEHNEFYGSFGHIPISLTGANGLVFRGNFCHDWNTGGDGAVQLKGGTHDALFDANLFQDITSDAGAVAFGDGCDTTCDIDPEHYAAVRARATNNLFVRVGRAFDVQGCKDCALLSNTMVDSGAGNVLIKLTSATTNGTTQATVNARILDNLMVNIGDVIQINSPAGNGLQMDYNLLWMGAWGGDHPATADAHGVMADPMLANDHSPTAAAIGAGINLFADVPADHDGNPRPQSGNFTIGAFQR